ncbi:MAG TPA: hypothetical protein PK239_10200 [Chitinophagales bacterium]|nr:hypothetical protein [Chitinophagales bacterium]HRK27649.1 hypothetical protein [Chitinophagales bacterium]
MENQNPLFVEITTPQEQTQKSTLNPPPTENNQTPPPNFTDDPLLRAIADAGMELLKQLAKERVTKLVNNLQQQAPLPPDEGKKALEKIQLETELARLRNEQALGSLSSQTTPQVPTFKNYKKLKKRVKQLEQEIRELKAMLLLLNNK